MVEAAYVCAQAIKRGQYPFLVHGEGMANIKETPFDCIVNGKNKPLPGLTDLLEQVMKKSV